MHMEITSEDDLYFLYTLQVSEEEFQDLRTEQSLLVDFSSFPPKFVELLQGCVTGRSRPGEPQFLAILDLKGLPSFNVVEANQFKQLTHLSLRVQPATDAALKAYLAGRLRLSLKNASETREQLDAISQQLNDQKKATESAKVAADELKHELEHTSEKLRVEFERALAKQKEDSVKLLSQTQNASTEQARRQQQHDEKRIEELEAQLAALQTEHRKGYEGKTTAESENVQLKAKVATLEEVGKKNAEELNSLRVANRSLDATKFELEKKVSEQQLVLATLRQKLEDKEEILSKTNSQLDEALHRKTLAEEKAGTYKATTAKLQRKLELSVKEINKGNSVIEELHSEIKHLKDKMTTKNMVIRQQENVVQSTREQLEDANRQSERLESLLKEEKANSSSLKSALEQSRTKLEECNKMLESNQNVITFLNKEINQNQFGRSPTQPASMASHYLPISHESPAALPPFNSNAELFTSPTRNQGNTGLHQSTNFTPSPMVPPALHVGVHPVRSPLSDVYDFSAMSEANRSQSPMESHTKDDHAALLEHLRPEESTMP